MKRILSSSSVDWDYFDKFDHVIDQYLPGVGEGDTYATQVCTAVNKLIYRWYNDGDVYDNTYYLEGWANNNLSSYANWLRRYTHARNILDRIFNIKSSGEYEEILKDLADFLLDEEWLSTVNSQPTTGSIYHCDGPYRFVDQDAEDEDDYY